MYGTFTVWFCGFHRLHLCAETISEPSVDNCRQGNCLVQMMTHNTINTVKSEFQQTIYSVCWRSPQMKCWLARLFQTLTIQQCTSQQGRRLLNWGGSALMMLRVEPWRTPTPHYITSREVTQRQRDNTSTLT